MSLRNQIQEDIHQALKNKKAEKLAALRFLNAQIQNKEIDKGRQELVDEEVIQVISAQLKKLKESLDLFKKGNRDDLVTKTKNEMAILTSYLPQQLSDEELVRKVDKIIADNPNVPHPGALIGIAAKKLGSQADNQRIAQLVKAKTKSS